MDAANYVEHFKVLGKLCKLWDITIANLSTEKTLISVAYDQFATGLLAQYDTILLLNPHMASLNSAINKKSDAVAAIKSVAASMAAVYLTAPIFTGDLTTVPTTLTNTTSVLTALQTEMGVGGGDNVTLTDTASVGFVNFFDVNWSPTGVWNTTADASATYKDSTYVVDTIV